MSRTGTVQGLTDEQRFALMKFRRSVADIALPEHDDNFLLRWLRARSWNAQAAEKMLRDSMQWRDQWQVDRIEKWEPPEVFQDYFPSGTCGYDKEGSPVIFVPFTGVDLWGLLHSASRSDLVRMVMRDLERYLADGIRQSVKHGIGARQVIAVFDMEGFNIRDYLWRPASDFVISLIKMYEANYPEILKACYIINAPKVFALAFSVVKVFMDEYTISKIHIIRADPAKWKPLLLGHVHAEELPKHYGGVMTDPNGDPKCPSKIRPGGKVPKSFFRKNLDGGLTETFKETTVRKGEKLVLDFHCTDPGCFIKWEFHTDGHDIGFGIVRKQSGGSGSETPVVPVARVAGNRMDEVGFIPAEPEVTYSVIFDNSYSYMRNKKLHYSVNLTTPMDLQSSSVTPTDI